MKNTILLVDDEKDFRQECRECLSCYDVLEASNGEEAIAKLRSARNIDLLILDIRMPGPDGFAVKDRLNNDPSTKYIPVIFLTAKEDFSDKIKGLRMGIDDYITKPFRAEELLARIDSILNKKKFYEEISMTDALTGIYNCNLFKKEFNTFFEVAKRYGQVFSLALIDIDNLKIINDTYGHIAGDLVLRKFSSLAKKVLRKSDIVTRYGGDEFAVILPGVDEERACMAMKRLKECVQKEGAICTDTGEAVNFSVSIGTSSYADSIKNEGQLFEAADAEMYRDKKNKKISFGREA